MKNQLTILGSGTCYSSFYKPWDYRNPSGHLLQVNRKNILLDAGDGIRRKMEEVRFDYYNLDAICISHFHPDHFSIDALVQAIYVRAKKEKKRKTLAIYGPATIEKRFIDIWNMKNIPSFKETFPGVLDITFYKYIDHASIQIADLLLTPFGVLHGRMDAYALRFMIDNTSIVYSGDCQSCDQVVDAALNADIFVCESGNDIGDEKSKGINHLTPYQAGEIARKANVKKLVLVHYSGKDPEDRMVDEIKRAKYRGEIAIAKDMDTYKL